MKSYNGFSLSDLFTYDPDTGIVRHNPDRPVESFKTTRGYNVWATSHSGSETGCSTRGYLYTRFTVVGVRCMEFNHRIALQLSGYTIPEGMHVDHIDGDSMNNKLSNLRVVTCQDNARNAKLHSNSTSGITGVRWCKRAKKWVSRIHVSGESVYLGIYSDKEDAIKARQEANIKYGFHENHGRS